MTFEGQAGIGLAHAAAVVYHLHQCPAGVAYHHAYLRGAGVDGVLGELLNDRGGTLNDFAGSYLVGYRVGEELNDVTHRCGLEA